MVSSFQEHLPEIIHADTETRDRSAYCWDNRDRHPKGTLVIQQTLSGSGLLEEGGERHPVPEGTAMIFAYGEGSRYGIADPGTGTYRLRYVVLRRKGGIGELIDRLRVEFGNVISLEQRGEASGILKTIAEAFRFGEIRDQIELAELAYRFVLVLYREQISGTAVGDPVAYLRHLLRSGFRSPRNIKEWTRDLPASREHLTRAFQARYGESPARYLRERRLEHARLLARGSTMTAADIARASGFSNTQTLRRAFRQRFGESLGSL